MKIPAQVKALWAYITCTKFYIAHPEFILIVLAEFVLN